MQGRLIGTQFAIKSWDYQVIVVHHFLCTLGVFHFI